MLLSTRKAVQILAFDFQFVVQLLKITAPTTASEK